MYKAKAHSPGSATAPLSRTTSARGDPTENDIQITADVEVIPIHETREAYHRLLKADVKYRFTIDMASLKSE